MRSRIGARLRAGMAPVVVAAVVLAGMGVPAQGALAPPPAAAGAGQPTAAPVDLAPGRYHVTLLTGDRVTLDVSGAGRLSVTVDPAVRPDGSRPSVDVRQPSRTGLYAIPSDARPYLDSGRLDRELFNVGYLAANGLDDGRRQALPLILQYPSQVAAATQQQRAAGLPGSTATHTLESIGAVAIAVDKGQAAAFWAALSTGQPAAAALDGGAAKVWLDRPVTVDLAESVPQIGAPQAWAAGYDGAGVKVAVLDTGIDPTHPDVAGKTIASRSFIAGEAVTDGHGHGTHVAATVAGTGAASGGARKGVAPGAELIVGKVLNDQGSGTFSQIIEGMEWATLEQGADVVSMSLGGDPTDGTDPGSEAVNRLTAETGALFVIAAGNGGRSGAFTVGAPGAADAALTVAAVSKADELADFSSRGPRAGDGALKPDISGPGVGIVAARAAGTEMGTPVDDRYTSANGTSMATPHVAGAAAILAQRHPDWTAAELKPALMSTATDGGYTAYEQGAGRVDVARAVTRTVVSRTASIDFKVIPFEDDDPRTGTISYANAADQPVTLTLTSRLTTSAGAPAPAGAFTVPASVTVPAGGTATTEVRAEPGLLDPAQYAGAVVASAPDGTRLITPVGFAVGDQRFRVSVTVDGRDGSLPFTCNGQLTTFCGTISALGVDGAGTGGEFEPAAAASCLTPEPCTRKRVEFYLPRGTYLLEAQILWKNPADPQRDQRGWLFNPEFTVDGELELHLDADRLQKVDVRTPRPTETHYANWGFHRTVANGQTLAWLSFLGWNGFNFWATPTQEVRVGAFRFWSNHMLRAPMVTMSLTRPERIDLSPVYPSQIRGEAHRFPAGSRTLKLVYVGAGGAEDFARVDASGRLVLIRSGQCGIDPQALERAIRAGAAGAIAFSGTGCTLPIYSSFPPPDIPLVNIADAEGDRLAGLLRRGPATLHLTSTPVSPYLYDLKLYHSGRVPDSLRHDLRDRDLATVHAHYHSAQPNHAREFNRDSGRWWPGEYLTAGSWMEADAPYSRTEYIGPTYPDLVYNLGVEAGLTAGVEGHLGTFHRGQRLDLHWNTLPLAPGALAIAPEIPRARPGDAFLLSAASRQADRFYPAMYQTTSAKTIEAGMVGSDGRTIHLYRGDQELSPVGGVLGLQAYDLPPEPARYRLTMDGQNWSAAWRFTSSRVTSDATPPGHFCPESYAGSTQPCRPEPLIFLRFDPRLDLFNTARATGNGELTITAYKQAPGDPAIATLMLWTSVDDGATWRPTKVKARGGGVFTARVNYPTRTGGAVSLRAHATDTAGNQVELTLLRAYHLRPANGRHN